MLNGQDIGLVKTLIKKHGGNGGGTTSKANYSKNVLSTEWILQSNGMYKTTINHNLGTNDIIVDFYEGSNLGALTGVEIATTNQIHIYNDTAVNGKVVINGGYKEVDMSVYQNKTDDNLTTTDKTIVGGINEIKTSLDTTNEQLEHIANKGTTVEVLERVTKEEIDRQIADGTIANLTIEDNSITTEKIKADAIDGNKIKEKSINPTHIATTTTTRDVYNPHTNNKNTIIGFRGELITRTGFQTTDFICVDEGDIITVRNGRVSTLGAMYDNDKNFVKGIAGYGVNEPQRQLEFVVDDSKVKFIKICINESNDYFTDYSILKTQNIKPTAIDWLLVNETNLANDISKNINHLSNTLDEKGNIKITSIEGYSSPDSVVNLFDKDKFFNDRFINNTGIEVPNSNFPYVGVTDFIPVKGNSEYIINFEDITNWLSEYDENKVHIRHWEGKTGVVPRNILVSENTKYIRVNVNTNVMNLDDFYVTAKPVEPAVEVPTFDWLEKRLSLLEIDTGGGSIPPTEGIGDLMAQKFKNMNVLVTGDSITEKNFRTTKNWHDYLSDWYGFKNIYNDGLSGSGLVKNNGIVYRISDWQRKYGNAIDMILVMGNMNDGTSGETGTPQWLGTFADQTDDKKDTSLYGALHYTCKQLIERYPNIPIGFITSQPRNQVGSQGKCWGIDGWFERWVQAINEVCGHYSIPVLDLYHNSGLRPWNSNNNAKFFSCASSPSGDGIHPNHLGHELMARKIYEFVNQYM